MAARLTAYLVSLIVGATLIAGLIVGAQNDGDGPVDLIVYNGKVYTGGAQPTAEAVAIRGNRILRVGSDWEIRRLRRRQTRLVDARGGTVLPGFNEVHARVMEGGLSLDDRWEGLLEPAVSQHSRTERLHAVRNLIAEAHRFGITSIQDIGADAEDLELYEELRLEEALNVRLYALLAVPPDLTEEDAARLEAIRQQYPDDPLLKTGGVRVSMDERAPGAQPLSSGQASVDTISRPTQAELNRVVALMDGHGWQVVVHAPTDDAVDMALDAFLYAIEVNPVGERSRRHRIELDVPLDDVDWRRFESLGLFASLRRLATPSASSIDTGDPIALGNGWPVDSLDPLPIIVTAAGAEPTAGVLATTIDAYTRAPAYASFDEHRKGVIAADMLADLVVLSTDIFSLPPERWADSVVVDTTIFDGRVVYTRDESAEQTE